MAKCLPPLLPACPVKEMAAKNGRAIYKESGLGRVGRQIDQVSVDDLTGNKYVSGAPRVPPSSGEEEEAGGGGGGGIAFE
jgi:hypothetical protein